MDERVVTDEYLRFRGMPVAPAGTADGTPFATSVIPQPVMTTAPTQYVPPTIAPDAVPLAPLAPLLPAPLSPTPSPTIQAVPTLTVPSPGAGRFPSSEPVQQQEPSESKRLRDAWNAVRQRHRHSIVFGMGGPYNVVANDPRGLSYSVYYYEHFMVAVPDTRVLKIDGTAPSYDTIRTKTYPLVSEVYAVILKGSVPNHPAVKLRDWLLSKDGQRCIRESGYTPIDADVASEVGRKNGDASSGD